MPPLMNERSKALAQRRQARHIGITCRHLGPKASVNITRVIESRKVMFLVEPRGSGRANMVQVYIQPHAAPPAYMNTKQWRIDPDAILHHQHPGYMRDRCLFGRGGGVGSFQVLIATTRLQARHRNKLSLTWSVEKDQADGRSLGNELVFGCAGWDRRG